MRTVALLAALLLLLALGFRGSLFFEGGLPTAAAKDRAGGRVLDSVAPVPSAEVAAAPAVTASSGRAATLALTVSGSEPTLTWAELLASGFDPARAYPARVAGDPDDLVVRSEQLIALAGADGQTFGDLALAVAGVRGDPAAVDTLLASWSAGLPADVAELAAELLRDDELLADDWDPRDDGERDGMAFGVPWDVPPAAWGVDDERVVQQAASFAYADLHALATVGLDYAAYPEHVGMTYESIHTVPGSVGHGLDPDGRPFSYVQIEFRADLPFPFGAFDCRMHVLNRLDARGRHVTDVYSTSPDLHWLAGHDVLLPVFASSGAFAGTIGVRHFGFDLVGIPDPAVAHRGAVRGGLGNFKRLAERLFAERGGQVLVGCCDVPLVPVTG